MNINKAGSMRRFVSNLKQPYAKVWWYEMRGFLD